MDFKQFLTPTNIVLFLSFVSAVAGVPLIQVVKGKLKVDNKKALLVSLGVSLVLAVASLLGTGQIAKMPMFDTTIAFSLSSVLDSFMTVWALATLIFKVFVSDKK